MNVINYFIEDTDGYNEVLSSNDIEVSIKTVFFFISY